MFDLIYKTVPLWNQSHSEMERFKLRATKTKRNGPLDQR